MNPRDKIKANLKELFHKIEMSQDFDSVFNLFEELLRITWSELERFPKDEELENLKSQGKEKVKHKLYDLYRIIFDSKKQWMFVLAK